MEKTTTRDIERAALINKTADMAGVTTRSVRRVLDGDQKNDKVLDAFMMLEEGENLLVQAVKELIGF